MGSGRGDSWPQNRPIASPAVGIIDGLGSLRDSF